MTVTNSYTRQPTKLDYASPTQFKFQVIKLPKVEYFCTSANLPGINLGTAEQIQNAIQSLEMLSNMDVASIADSLEEDGKFYYNVIGDDLFHDALDNAERSAAMGNIDGAQNNLADAIGRAEDLLVFVQKREGLKEEEAGEADKVASDIQKAMNKHKKDDAKMHQLQKARTAMNKGDLEKAKKIAARLAEKLKSE